jgi:hypothetical protein
MEILEMTQILPEHHTGNNSGEWNCFEKRKSEPKQNTGNNMGEWN